MKKLVYSVILLLSLSMLTACGYALRGSSSAVLPPQLQTLQLQSSGGNSELIQATRRALNNSGVTLIDESEEGVYQLSLGSEQLAERVISVNSSARAGEYELTMTVPFQLSSADEFIVEPEVLVSERVYQADPNNAVAKAEEAALIRNEMRQAIVNQLLRRLESLSF